MAFDKVEYWKNRINNTIKSALGYAFPLIQSIRDNVKHMNLEDKEIFNALRKIEEGFIELQAAIKKAEVKGGK